MSDIKRVGDAAILFDVTPQTIRRWTDEFSDYLSTGANPDNGSTRVFSESDMSVLALIATVKNTGGTYDDAHARLRTGERGIVPDEPLSKEQQEMAISQVIIQNQQLQTQVNDLQEQLEAQEGQLREARDEISRLKGIIEEKEKSYGDSGQELGDARKRIEELLMKVAVLEYQLNQQKDD